MWLRAQRLIRKIERASASGDEDTLRTTTADGAEFEKIMRSARKVDKPTETRKTGHMKKRLDRLVSLQCV